MKKLWRKIPYKSLLGILLPGSLIFYLLSYRLEPINFLHEALLHLASICIELVIATFFVDKVVIAYKNAQRHKKWREAEDVAREDLKDLSLSLAYTILLSLNIYIPVEPDEVTEEEEIQGVINQILTFKKRDSKKLISKMPAFTRYRLKENITILKPEFETTLLLYKEILPINLLEQLWKTRVTFNKFYSSYTRDIDFVFEGTDKNPLTQEAKEHQKMLKLGFLNIISQDLNNYINEVEKLIKLIANPS